MSSTLLTSTRGQPTVLQLLPFSENDSISGTSLMPTQKNAEFSSRTMIGFPVLAVSVAEIPTKSGTKHVLSSNSEDTSIYDNHRKKLPVLTTHADKRFRRYSENTNNHHGLNLQMEPLPSETMVSDTCRLDRHDVKVRSRSQDDSQGAVFAEDRADNYNCYENTGKPFPKPSFKPKECQWFHSNKKYLKTLPIATNYKEEFDGQKVNISKAGLSKRQARRIKFNVKELPRSKTPIADNDPDKLNMKNVIAFLQSSNKFKADEDHHNDEASSKKIILKPKFHLSKRLSLRSEVTKTGMNAAFFDQKQQTIKLNHRPTSNNSRNITSDCEESASVENQQFDTPQRPKSLDKTHTQHEIKNVSMPPIVSKLQNRIDKSFRLHRFVTLAPNAHSNLSNISDKLSHDHAIYNTPMQNAHLPENSQEVNSFSSSETAETSKTQDRWNYETEHIISGTMLTTDTIDESLFARREKRSNLKTVHTPKNGTERISNMNNVICLPTANVEADSDEESSLILTSANADFKKVMAVTTIGCNIGNEEKNTYYRNQVSGSHCETDKAMNNSNQEHIIFVPVGITNSSAPNTSSVDNKYGHKHSKTSNSHLDQLSNDLTENSLTETRNYIASSTVIKEENTRKETALNTYQLNTHQKTFIRLLNQELATLKRTTTWLDHQSNVLSPLVYKHTLPDGTKNTSDARETVKLSLRRERNKTRFHTYMTDMEDNGQP